MSVENYVVHPAQFKLDGGAMFGIIPKPLWQKVHPSDELNRINLSLRLWLIKTPTRVVLIDTGIGDFRDEKFVQNFDVRSEENPIGKSLQNIGLSLDSVTDLVISHLHFDHVGGISRLIGNEHVPTMPNAKLHLHKRHYDYSLDPSEKDKGSFHSHIYQPIVEYYEQKQQLHWLEDDQGEIINDKDLSLKFLTSNGHTQDLIHPYTDKYIYLTDIVPTSNHVHVPWIMAYDNQPNISASDKRRILKFAIDNNLKVIFEHDPLYWGCEVAINEEKKKFVNKTKFESEQSYVQKI